MKPASDRLPADLEPLRQQCIEIDRRLSAYRPSISGVCIPDQEDRTALLRKWQFLSQEYTRQARAAGATEIYVNDLRG